MLCSKWGAASGASTWAGLVVRAISPRRRCAAPMCNCMPLRSAMCKCSVRACCALSYSPASQYPSPRIQRQNLLHDTWPVARCLGTTWARTSTPRCGSPARHQTQAEGGLSPRFVRRRCGFLDRELPVFKRPPQVALRYKLLRGRWPRRRGHCCLQIPHSHAPP